MSFVKIEDEVKLTIYDLLGREIARQNYNDPSQFFNESLDLSHFANGIYVLQIVNGSHFTSKKIQIR